VPRKDHEGDGIVVHWDSDRCVHAGECVRGLPDVFDTSARPWIRPSSAVADDIAAVVDRCPSGALTYTRTDGGLEGPAARRPDADVPAGSDDPAVSIAVRAAGPLVVMGPVEVRGAGGELLEASDRVFLCRCGQSGRKPFCDGSHKAAGFSG
jgi:uncharacterized Fe-S cluster protein YjdI